MNQIDLIGGSNNEIPITFPKPEFLKVANHLSEFNSPYDQALARQNLGIRSEVNGTAIIDGSITKDKLSSELQTLLRRLEALLSD